MNFRDHYLREHATTRKVLHAFPPDQFQFKPHERSTNAHKLGWLFYCEERIMARVLRGEPAMGGGFPPPPETWQEVLDAFDRQHEELKQLLETTEIKGTVKWFVGPGQTADMPAEEFLMFMLHDQIHHRGQFSVYLRMVGGKVPSIYGPSADEPWF